VTSTAAAAGFTRLSGGTLALPGAATVASSLTVGGPGSFGGDVAAPAVMANAYTFGTPVCDAVTLGAVDFQPTVTAQVTVARVYDEFGATTAGANSKLGASIHPPNGATPAELACWFQTTSSGNPQAVVAATLWRIPQGGGAVAPGSLPMATVSMSGATPVTTPTRVATSTFVGGDFVTYDAAAGGSGSGYLVELSFPDFSYPTFKVSGCVVSWCSSRLLP
jgi:hypothetical protein